MFEYKNLYINDYFTVVGPLEAKSKLKNYDLAINDFYYDKNTIEKAEIKMQKNVLNYFKNNYHLDLVIGSDLINQLAITNKALEEENIPYIGLYSACASSVAGIITIGNFLNQKRIKNGLYLTSSHNLNAEKQFRFPVEYGSPKPKRSTFTTTASIGILLSKNESNIKVINGTIGSVIDSKIKDVYNMGAVMAPSAVDTLLKHLKLTKTEVKDYDLILTGDLGEVGAKIFKELLKNEGINIKNHIDAGTLIYENKEYSGASGPTVLPVVLFNNIIYNPKYKKILLLATGSLHSPMLINQKHTIPSITHALVIEVEK